MSENIERAIEEELERIRVSSRLSVLRPLAQAVEQEARRDERAAIYSALRRHINDGEQAIGANEHDLTGPGYHAPGQAPHTGSRAKGNARTFRGGGAYTGGRSFQNSADVLRESHGNVPNLSGMRNRRTVWTITTQPFSGAHFAVMPEALVEPCILAGSEPGDTVIDPTCGAATVGVVALRHQRNFTGCDLNGDYVAMGSRRIVADAPLWNTPAEAQP